MAGFFPPYRSRRPLVKPLQPVLQKNTSLAYGLELAYLFHRNEGGKVTDFSGNNNTGTKLGSPPQMVASPFGYAGNFDGTTQAIKTVNLLDLSTTTQITVSFWLNWKLFTTTDNVYVEFSDNYNNVNDGFVINPDASDTLAFEFSMHDGVNYDQPTIPQPSSDVWHHYVFIIDRSRGAGASAVAIYRDGVSQVISYPGLSGALTGNFGKYNLYFGGRLGTPDGGVFRLDNFLLYTRLLTREEAIQLYADPYKMWTPPSRAFASEVAAATTGNFSSRILLMGVGI